jgi:hypothetical protein
MSGSISSSIFWRCDGGSNASEIASEVGALLPDVVSWLTVGTG